MTLLSYQVFKTVAEMGSFRKAADILGLTPSAISHTISAMEKELGFSLLNRSKSGVTMTNYGEQLMPYVNAVLNSDESLQQVVAEFKGLKQGTVKVGCFASVCTNFMPSVITSFREQYPAIEIEVFQGTYDDVVYWIRNGIVDFGFLSASSAGDLYIEPFYRDPLLCIVPGDYEKKEDAGMVSSREEKQGGGKAKNARERHTDVMTIKEMAEMQFVVQRESTDADIQNYLKENHLDIQTRYHVVDDLSTVALVESGFGICIMPELTMRDIPYKVRRYRMEPDAFRMIGLAALNPELMAPAVRTLYRYILEKYRNI